MNPFSTSLEVAGALPLVQLYWGSAGSRSLDTMVWVTSEAGEMGLNRIC